MKARVTGMLAAVAAVAIAGCGSSSGFAKESGSQILSAAAAATRAANSYSAVGSLTQGAQQMQVQLGLRKPSNLSADVTTGADQFKLIIADNTPYIWANAAYWRKQATGAAAKLAGDFAGKWFKTTAAEIGGIGSQFSSVGPTALADCIASEMPNPKVDGTTSVNGTNAVLVTSNNGGTGGTHKTTIAIATSSPHYLLKITSSGTKTTAGSGACSSGPESGQGSLTLSRWNSTTVGPPANAVSLP